MSVAPTGRLTSRRYHALVETAPSILELGLLFLAAVAFGWTARRLGLPAVVGYLVLGLVVSPFTPGYVADRAQLQLLADVGVVLLLFEVGIEVDLGRLRREQRGLMWVSPLQVVLTTAIGGIAAWMAGLAPIPAALVGLSVALSSSVVIVNITRSRRRTTDRPTESALLGWSVLQDVTGVAIAVVLLAALGPTTGRSVPRCWGSSRSAGSPPRPPWSCLASFTPSATSMTSSSSLRSRRALPSRGSAPWSSGSRSRSRRSSAAWRSPRARLPPRRDDGSSRSAICSPFSSSSRSGRSSTRSTLGAACPGWGSSSAWSSSPRSGSPSSSHGSLGHRSAAPDRCRAGPDGRVQLRARIGARRGRIHRWGCLRRVDRSGRDQHRCEYRTRPARAGRFVRCGKCWLTVPGRTRMTNRQAAPASA